MPRSEEREKGKGESKDGRAEPLFFILPLGFSGATFNFIVLPNRRARAFPRYDWWTILLFMNLSSHLSQMRGI